jgi:hypothetical protein
VDGKKLSWDNVRIGGSTGNPAENIVFEGNWITNGGHMGMGIFDARNVTVRHNLIENTGQHPEGEGEGVYVSSANHGRPVIGVEIYGNTFRRTTDNLIDYKGQARNVNVHHNIFEQHRKDLDGWCGDGLIRSEGSNTAAGNYFQNNIVRNSPDSCYTVRLSSNRVDVLDNVFSNVGGRTFVDGRTTSSAVIRGNTLCKAPTGGNRSGNQTASSCSVEEQRIMNELRRLPRCGTR